MERSKYSKLYQTKKERAQARRLARLVKECRSRVSRKRKPIARKIAVLEGALEIIKKPAFWTKGDWFRSHSGGGGSDELSGARTYDGLCSAATRVDASEEDVISVCAEGAIELVANGTEDGAAVIALINNTDAVQNSFACDELGSGIRDVNDDPTRGQKDTVKLFKEAIAELKREHKVK